MQLSELMARKVIYFRSRKKCWIYYQMFQTGFFLFVCLEGSGSASSPSSWATMHIGHTPSLLYSSPQHCSSEGFVQLKIGWARDAWLQFSDRPRTGISILTSAAGCKTAFQSIKLSHFSIIFPLRYNLFRLTFLTGFKLYSKNLITQPLFSPR